MNWKAGTIASIVVNLILIGSLGYAFMALPATPGSGTSTAVRTQVATTTVTVAPTQTTQQLTEVSISAPTRGSIYQLSVVMAQARGYFAAEGLKVNLVYLAGDAGINALLSGQVQFAVQGPTPFINPVLKGADLKMIDSTLASGTAVLVGRPDITSPSQLNGKKVGSEIPGSLYYTIINAIVQKYNLSITQVPFDNTPARVTALQANQISGALIDVAASIPLIQQGYHILATQAEVFKGPEGFIVTTGAYIKDHPDVVQRAVNAIVHGVAAINSLRNATISTISDYVGVTPAQATIMYDIYRLTFTNDLNVTAIQQSINFYVVKFAGFFKPPPQYANGIPLGQVSDFSFFNKAIAKGV